MSIYTPTIQGIYIPLASGARTATQTIVGKDIIDPKNADARFSTTINPEVSGLAAYLNITSAPGGDTVQLVLEEQDPASLVWSQVLATTATSNAGMVRMKIKQAIQSISATQSQVQIQDTLPAIWRLRVVHSGAGSFTYSVGLVLYN